MTKILLVDDSKFLRLTAERALARAGYEVSSATDGEKALRMAREELPDLILMDILLPKISGRDVLLALKKDPATKAIPVVVMTGLSQKNAARLQGDGAIAFWKNPFSIWIKDRRGYWRRCRRFSRNFPNAREPPRHRLHRAAKSWFTPHSQIGPIALPPFYLFLFP